MISYAPFWKTMRERGETTYSLVNKYNLSRSLIDRLKNNKGISTAKIDDLCKILDCKVEDILEYVKD